MTVNELILKLQHLKPSLHHLDIVVIMPNGIEGDPHISLLPENPFDLRSDVKKVVITYCPY